MKKSTLLILTTGVLLGVETFKAISNSAGGPPAGNTGAPGEGLCTDCHSDNAVNSGSAAITLTYNSGGAEDTTYDPGQPGMLFQASLTESGSEKAGIQTTALDLKNNRAAGSFTVGDPNKTMLNHNGKSGTAARQYIQHKTGQNILPGGQLWAWGWDPPNWNAGRIRFYVAFNGSDANGGSDGDYIYTRTFDIDHFEGWKVGFNKNRHNDLKYAVFPSTVSDFVNVTYTNAQAQQVNIELVSLDGKKVHTLAKGNQAQGEVNQRLDLPSGLSSGLYLVRLTAGQQTLTKKVFVNQ